MKISRCLVIAALIVGVVGLQLTFAAAVARRPTVTIMKAQIPQLSPGAMTGLVGTIKVMGTLPVQLKTMQCMDMKVYIGTWKTPPSAGNTISIPVFEEVASAAATGNIATTSCDYSVKGIAPGTYDIMVNANPMKFACDRTSLSMPPIPKTTFQAGKTITMNLQVTPKCEIVK